MRQTLGDRKFQGRQVGLKSQPFSMWLEAKLLRQVLEWVTSGNIMKFFCLVN